MADVADTELPVRGIDVKNCPACGADGFTITGGEVPGFTVNCGGREFEQPPYGVQECPSCSLLFKRRTASSAELDAYYARVDFRKWELAGHYPTERAVLAILRAMPKGARLLDFGCSSGRLFAPLVGDHECYGFEINPEAAAMAATKGLKILGGDFLKSDQGQRFDAVVLVDVFEHLSSPTDLLLQLYARLRPGGLLLLVTGNGDFPACRLDPGQFWYFRNVEHLCMLTRRHGEHLACRLGAHLELWQEMSHYDAPPLKRIQQLLRHFSYWQFQHRTFLSRTLLPLLPVLKRACHWPVAPAYDTGRDHVVLGLRKR